nr:hypothetical protein [Tanacetum cinerariifolium]
ARLSRWSMKKPVFWPVSQSTANWCPFSCTRCSAPVLSPKRYPFLASPTALPGTVSELLS